MKQFKKLALLSFITILGLTCSSFKLHHWQHEEEETSTNVLEQFYPDQNAYRLHGQIPQELRHLSYGIYPISRGYDTARFNFNKRFNIFPHLILCPRNNEEIVHVLKVLKKHHLPFSVRSGGHCLEPGSLTTGYVIDLRNFNWIKPDVKKKEVYIGAGCRLGSVIKKLGKLDFAIPTGTCSSVGVTGLSLGGGIGVLARAFGLTTDSIKSITLLTAEGEIIEVNDKHYPDLFWALRGAGNGSFGIVLGFTFKMHYVPHASTLTLTWNWTPDTVTEVFAAWQTWIQTLPNTITTELDLTYMNHQLGITVSAVKVGKKPFTEWKSAFANLNPKVKITHGSYLDSAQVWADRAPYPFLKSKSEMIFEPLGSQPIQSAITFFEQLKLNNQSYYALFELQSLGGAVSKGNTAYFPRAAIAWWYHVMYWDKETMQPYALEQLQTFSNDIAPFVSPYSYANIVDYDLGNIYLNAYYGTNVNQLIQIKSKYDPNNLFHWKQSIPPWR